MRLLKQERNAWIYIPDLHDDIDIFGGLFCKMNRGILLKRHWQPIH